MSVLNATVPSPTLTCWFPITLVYGYSQGIQTQVQTPAQPSCPRSFRIRAYQANAANYVADGLVKSSFNPDQLADEIPASRLQLAVRQQ